MEDSGKLNDDVRLTIAVADRENRAHRYGYRHVMRYEIDERDDGMVFISFWSDPTDRMHEVIRHEDQDDNLTTRIMRTLLDYDPRLLDGNASSSGNSCGALACVMGMLMASVYTKQPGAFGHVRERVIAKIDTEAARTLEKVTEFMQEAASGESPLRS